MKVAFFIVVSCMLLMETVSAFHGKNELICEKCHTVHYSEDGSIPQPGEGPSAHLLVNERSTELCLTCHDGKAGTPDVIGADDVNGLMERAAGFFAPVNVDNANGHNLGLDGTRGGYGAAEVGCIDCHDPHGRDTRDPDYRYRNLQWASDVGSEPMIRTYVKPGAMGIEVYEQHSVGYAAPDSETSEWREVTNICFGCHDSFKSDGYTRDSDGTCIRHPSTDSERGIWELISRRGPPHTDPTHWVDGGDIGFAMGRLPFIVSGATDYVEATTVAKANEVFCLTCHKAHGSGYKNSLRWPADSNLGCQQCHNKG